MTNKKRITAIFLAVLFTLFIINGIPAISMSAETSTVKEVKEEKQIKPDKEVKQEKQEQKKQEAKPKFNMGKEVKEQKNPSAYPAIAETEPQYIQKATTQERPSIGMKIFDVLLVRPLCVVGSTISTAAYLVISPLTYVMGLGQTAVETMVEAPWQFTACRYVGEFNHYKERCSLD